MVRMGEFVPEVRAAALRPSEDETGVLVTTRAILERTDSDSGVEDHKSSPRDSVSSSERDRSHMDTLSEIPSTPANPKSGVQASSQPEDCEIERGTNSPSDDKEAESPFPDDTQCDDQPADKPSDEVQKPPAESVRAKIVALENSLATRDEPNAMGHMVMEKPKDHEFHQGATFPLEDVPSLELAQHVVQIEYAMPLGSEPVPHNLITDMLLKKATIPDAAHCDIQKLSPEAEKPSEALIKDSNILSIAKCESEPKTGNETSGRLKSIQGKRTSIRSAEADLDKIEVLAIEEATFVDECDSAGKTLLEIEVINEKRPKKSHGRRKTQTVKAKDLEDIVPWFQKTQDDCEMQPVIVQDDMEKGTLEKSVLPEPTETGVLAEESKGEPEKHPKLKPFTVLPDVMGSAGLSSISDRTRIYAREMDDEAIHRRLTCLTLEYKAIAEEKNRRGIDPKADGSSMDTVKIVNEKTSRGKPGANPPKQSKPRPPQARKSSVPKPARESIQHGYQGTSPNWRRFGQGVRNCSGTACHIAILMVFVFVCVVLRNELFDHLGGKSPVNGTAEEARQKRSVEQAWFPNQDLITRAGFQLIIIDPMERKPTLMDSAFSLIPTFWNTMERTLEGILTSSSPDVVMPSSVMDEDLDTFMEQGLAPSIEVIGTTQKRFSRSVGSALQTKALQKMSQGRALVKRSLFKPKKILKKLFKGLGLAKKVIKQGQKAGRNKRSFFKPKKILKKLFKGLGLAKKVIKQGKKAGRNKRSFFKPKKILKKLFKGLGLARKVIEQGKKAGRNKRAFFKPKKILKKLFKGLAKKFIKVGKKAGRNKRALFKPKKILKKLFKGIFLVKKKQRGGNHFRKRIKRSVPTHPGLVGTSHRIPGSFLEFSQTFHTGLIDTLLREGPETPAFLTKMKDIQGNPLKPKNHIKFAR